MEDELHEELMPRTSRRSERRLLRQHRGMAGVLVSAHLGRVRNDLNTRWTGVRVVADTRDSMTRRKTGDWQAWLPLPPGMRTITVEDAFGEPVHTWHVQISGETSVVLRFKAGHLIFPPRRPEFREPEVLGWR